MILASASPQRAAILRQLGIPFEVVVPDVDEIESGTPAAVCEENARRKANAVDGELVLAADTVVALEDEIYGKPENEAEARASLQALSGNTHTVWGGIALREVGTTRTATAQTQVTFRNLADHEIAWYLATEEWRGRAGGYAIQGRGAALVSAIEGDFWNVVGLPVAELLNLQPTLLST